MSKYYIGIEGGATHSTIVVLDSDGQVYVQLPDQPPTNHWIAGMESCCELIVSIIENALIKGDITEHDRICSLGLCLSGCEDDKTNDEMRILMKAKMPRIENVLVASDTWAPIFAVSNTGGAVLISGTGSNCLLVNPDKTSVRCGGWSYLLGDEGSGWWMAHMAVKICIDELDKFEKAPHNIDYVWNAVKDHFKITDGFGMLQHSYTNFNKPFYAELTLKLSDGARDGDDLCKYIFHAAGVALAKHMVAVSSKIDSELYERPEGLPIVCVGSVWASWPFLKEGFTSTIGIGQEGQIKLKRFSLLKLQVPSALGAALLAATDIPRNSDVNARAFYSWPLPLTNGRGMRY